jgi:hypothetical protein
MAHSIGGPSRAGYVIAVLVFLLGCLIAAGLAGWFAWSMFSLVSDFQRIVVPGTTQIRLNEPGGYTIYYEHDTEFAGQTYRTGESLPPLDIQVVEVSTGQPVSVRTPLADTNYDIQSRAGQSLMVFDIDRAGDYEITAEYPPGVDGPEVVLAIGSGIGANIAFGVGALLGSIGIFCGATLLVIAIVAVTFWRRRSHSQSVPPAYPTYPAP